MNKFNLYLETVDGRKGIDHNMQFDSIEEYESWLGSAQFKAYADKWHPTMVTLVWFVTGQPVLDYDVEFEY